MYMIKEQLHQLLFSKNCPLQNAVLHKTRQRLQAKNTRNYNNCD